ncbi:MAG: cell division protein FtsA [Minisyncoccia bacterium]
MLTALDIGSSFVKGIIVEEKNNRFNVINVFKTPSSGFKKGILVDVQEGYNTFLTVANDIKKINKKALKNTFITVNSEHIKGRIAKGSTVVARADLEIQKDDIEQAIESAKAGKKQTNFSVLHVINREFIVDDIGDFQEEPIGMSGSKLEASVYLVEAFSPHLNTLYSVLEKAGFFLTGTIFTPIASAKAVLSKKQINLGVMMIDFGFSTTSIVVYEDGKMSFAKSLPFGSSLITNDLARVLKISVDLAEKIKLMYGCAVAAEVNKKEMIDLSEFDAELKKTDISKRFIAEIIQSRMEEIIDLIDNELKGLGHSLELPGGLVLTGGGVKLTGSVDLFKQKMKLAVKIGFPDLSFFDIINPTYQDMLDDPEFSAAVGLVLLSSLNVSEKRKVSIKNIIKNFLP